MRPKQTQTPRSASQSRTEESLSAALVKELEISCAEFLVFALCRRGVRRRDNQQELRSLTLSKCNRLMRHSRGRASFFLALPGGGLVAQAHGRHDEGKVRERLRKIADLPSRLRIVFLREQADVVAQCEQAFEQGAGFIVAML